MNLKEKGEGAQNFVSTPQLNLCQHFRLHSSFLLVVIFGTNLLFLNFRLTLLSSFLEILNLLRALISRSFCFLSSLFKWQSDVNSFVVAVTYS